MNYDYGMDISYWLFSENLFAINIILDSLCLFQGLAYANMRALIIEYKY